MTILEHLNLLQSINNKSKQNTRKAKALLNLSDIVTDETLQRKIEKQLNKCDKLRVYYGKQYHKAIQSI